MTLEYSAFTHETALNGTAYHSACAVPYPARLVQVVTTGSEKPRSYAGFRFRSSGDFGQTQAVWARLVTIHSRE